MKDYVYPSIFFSYFFFALALVGALYFFARSFREGYWSEEGEAPKYRMLQDDEADQEGIYE